ncbi:hypothetical protein Ctob_012434 [Chrysochromulina tobinii]|uniref:Methyltransferase domain-containing protein n=1 Tax=Chrysochromulina tobinii TaxID=1460289 RepID=A0A0M0KDX0_9EUKA|nr:hypothetical protein Ctob_012434 [Chrysochromulina tobinii]|eukprot:KOO36618.1 hypothetical protein Ctob_012434 [Chrysochromulina sp. CCMP291]
MAVATRRCIDRKEFFEACEFFAQVQGTLVADDGLLIDVAGGHGLVGTLVALFKSKDFERVIIRDPRRPKAFDEVVSAAVEVAPWVSGRITYEQKKILPSDPLPRGGAAVVCVHGCKSLTDRIIAAAAEAEARSIALMPCCYPSDAAQAPTALVQSLGTPLASDVQRTYDLQMHGYEPAVEALLAERTDFVSMAKMQSMVRVTCLEIMNSAPEQVMEYRKEVLELKSMIQSYLLEVASFKEQMAASGSSGSSTCGSFPPSSPSSASTCDADPPTPSNGAPVTLQASFMPPPESAWYEHKTLPRFAVQLRLPSGKLYPHADVTLRVSMLNGRGLPEEQKANGSGELLVGERNARAGLAGLAEWDNLRIAEPSSKHYGSFTMLIDVERAPPGVTIEQLQVGPITIQVGRMWSKRRKSEAELTGDDSISQIPGVGARYVSRLQLHGVSTIGQFAAMAATEVGKATLCKLCKGDNPRNSLNDQKLQSMIDTATGVVRGTVAYKKRSLGVVSGATTASARAVFGLGPAVDVPEPEFSMDELLLLASSDDSPSSPELEPLAAIGTDGSGGGFNLGFGTFRGGGGGVDMDLGDDDDDLIVRMRSAKLHSAPLDAIDHDMSIHSGVGGFAVLPPKAPPATGDAGCAIQILPSKHKSGLSGFAAFDALEAAPPAAYAATVPFAPPSPALAVLLRAAWHGDAHAIREAAVAAGPEAAAGVDRFGSTALHLAALNGRAEGVRALCGALDARALDAPSTALGDATALHLAAVRGARAEAAADALLDAGASATVLMAGDGVDVASMLGMSVEEAFTRLHGAEAGAEVHELA